MSYHFIYSLPLNPTDFLSLCIPLFTPFVILYAILLCKQHPTIIIVSYMPRVRYAFCLPSVQLRILACVHLGIYK